MSRHHASASRAELLVACGWWAHPDRVLDETGSQAASDGTDNHAELECAARGEPAAEWAQAATLDVPPDALPELMVAFDAMPPYGGRFLPESPGGARDYREATESEIPGTADLAWRDGDTLVVADWKTGPNAQDNTTPAIDNAQIATLALAAMHTELGVGATAIKLQLRFVGPGRELVIDEHETTPAELRERWADVLSGALDRVTADDELAPRPNPGCHWCPALSSCPAARVQVATVERQSAMAEDAILSTQIVSAEHAASVHARLRMASEMLDRIGGALKSYVRDNGPVPLGNGKVLRIGERTRESRKVDWAKMPPDTLSGLEASGLVTTSVSMYDELRVGAAEPRKRAKKAKASPVPSALVTAAADTTGESATYPDGVVKGSGTNAA